MADTWQTYQFEFRGGLISNLSPLQHGIQAPGSARILRNFEPSVDGGYKRISGFDKYDSAAVPSYGTPLVHGGSQTGTTLVVGDLHFAPSDGDSFTVAGVAGTYTIASGGVAYNATNKRATLTLTTSLDSSPADQAAITFTTNTGLVNGVASWENTAIAVRNNTLFSSSGSGWTKISVPSYGTVLVDGGSQTGGTLDVDGLTATPQVGDTFTIAGVDLIYTITAAVTVASGAASITISPNLDSSPADDAAITFLSAHRVSTNKHRFAKYRIATTEKLAGVDGTNRPFIWDDTTFKVLTTAPSDAVGASHIVWFKNQLFFAKSDVLTFTAPYTDDDFNPANGAGNISVGANITGLIVFREQLIIFSENQIKRLIGNTLADFVVQPITENIGCVEEDTIQEVGSDVMFLGPDGLRLLSATDRIGDFNIASISKTIQKETTDVITANASFASIVIKSKSQYRLLGYNGNITSGSSIGIIGSQLLEENSSYFAWASLRGFKAYVADSNYKASSEVVLFANDSGYVYEMENGNSLDGANIEATFSTPFVPINDPRLRKTFYKLFLYTDPTGSVEAQVSLKLDFDTVNVVQPPAISLANSSLGFANFYGNPTAKYGQSTYGGKLKTLFETQVVGSGFTVSLQFVSNNTVPPFSLDAATLEFATFDRR
jgi:hypothetical protein